jgi:hypothetical protein
VHTKFCDLPREGLTAYLPAKINYPMLISDLASIEAAVMQRDMERTEQQRMDLDAFEKKIEERYERKEKATEEKCEKLQLAFDNLQTEFDDMQAQANDTTNFVVFGVSHISKYVYLTQLAKIITGHGCTRSHQTPKPPK